MNKIKLLTFSTLLLFILNITLLLFLFLHQPFRKPREGIDRENEGPKRIIIERLNFDEDQIIKYEDLIDQHQHDLADLDLEMRRSKNELYQTLAQNQYPEKDSLENRIAQLQKEIEDVHFKHFIAIKSICKPNQIPLFNNLSAELAQLFTPKIKFRPPPKD